MSLLRSVRVLNGIARSCARVAATPTIQKRGMAEMKTEMAFTFASPSNVYYEGAKVNQVDVPAFNETIGILPNHVPLLAVLKPGVVTVYEEDNVQKKFFVSSGSVTINDDASVQILAEEAVRMEDLDAQAIRDGVNQAQQELSSAQTDQAKAEAQIAVDCYGALQKATS